LDTVLDFRERGPRPFDVDRDELVIGDGAGVLIFEAFERARRSQGVVRSQTPSSAIEAAVNHQLRAKSSIVEEGS